MMTRGKQTKPAEPEPEALEIDDQKQEPPKRKANVEPTISVDCSLSRQQIKVSVPGHGGRLRARVHRLDAKGYWVGDWTSDDVASCPAAPNGEFLVSCQVSKGGERGEWVQVGKVKTPSLGNLTKPPRG